MMYMLGTFDVLFLPVLLSNRFQTCGLWSLGIEGYYYDFFLRILSCSSGFIDHFLDQYVWIDVGLMSYMSGEASFIVWVDWNTDIVSKLGRHFNPLNARFDNQIAFALGYFNAGPVLQRDVQH